jgi:hypothetical protein
MCHSCPCQPQRARAVGNGVGGQDSTRCSCGKRRRVADQLDEHVLGRDRRVGIGRLAAIVDTQLGARSRVGRDRVELRVLERNSVFQV